jgi:hypothetical protein
MTALMVDAVNFGNVPKGAFKYAAGYLNGRFATPMSQLARFDGHLLIGVHPDDPTQARFVRCLDVERFDANPSDAPAFIRERIRHGHHDATIYCNRSTFPAIQKACAGLPYRLWLATLDGTKLTTFMGKTVWACQFETVRNADGPLYDVSEIFGTLDLTKP